MSGRGSRSTRRSLLAALGGAAAAGTAGCLRLTSTGEQSAGGTTDQSRGTDDETARSTRATAEEEAGEERQARETVGESRIEQLYVDSRNTMYQRGDLRVPDDPPVAWKRELDLAYHGRVGRGPVLSERHLFIASWQDVVAISRGDGSIDWRFSEAGVDDYLTVAGLALYEDAVVVAGENRRTHEFEVVGIDDETGREAWSVPIPVEESTGEHPTAVKVAGDRAYVGTNTRSEDGVSKLYACDLAAKRVAWQTTLADGNLLPEDVAISGSTAIVTTDEAPEGMANVVSFDLEERKRNWGVRLPIGEGIPTVDGERAYLPVQTEEVGDYVVALSLSDGSEAWRFEQLNAPRSGVSVDDSQVYTVADDQLYAIDAETGTPRWSESFDGEPRLSGDASGLPVLTDDRILLGSWSPDADRSTIHALAKDGSRAWDREVDDAKITSPLVADETLWSIGFDPMDDDTPPTLYALGGRPP